MPTKWVTTPSSRIGLIETWFQKAVPSRRWLRSVTVTSSPASIAARIAAGPAGSVSGPCRKRQLRPRTSSGGYPVVKVKAGLTKISGRSSARASATVNDRPVASTARSRSWASARASATASVSRTGRSRTSAWSPSPGASASGSPTTQSGSRSRVASEARRADTAWPWTGVPPDRRESGCSVSESSAPSTSRSPAASDQASTPAGRTTPGASCSARLLA